jgi:HSP20 family protein
MFRRTLPEVFRREADVRKPENLFDWMESFWRDPFHMPALREMGYPSVNVKDSDKEIRVEAEIPGMNPEDINISIKDDALVIQGEKRFEDEEKKENYQRVECSYGSFYRMIPLSSEVDEEKIKAKYKKGVLKVTLPKKNGTKSKKIQIES